jgi:hypothetical protein
MHTDMEYLMFIINKQTTISNVAYYPQFPVGNHTESRRINRLSISASKWPFQYLYPLVFQSQTYFFPMLHCSVFPLFLQRFVHWANIVQGDTESCFFVGFLYILLAPSQCCCHLFYIRQHKLLQPRRNTSDPTPQGRHVCLHDGESHAGNQSLQEAPFVPCGRRPHNLHTVMLLVDAAVSWIWWSVAILISSDGWWDLQWDEPS